MYNTTDTSNIVIDPYFIEIYDWAKLIPSVLCLVAMVLGIPGNVMVVLVHIRITRKCATDWLIFYLAVCDILSLVVVPNIIFQIYEIWAAISFPDVLCKLHLWHSNAVSMAAYMFAACTALERVVKICFSRDLFSMRQIQLMWLPICIISYCLAILSYTTVRNNSNGHCMIDLEQATLSAIAYGIVMVVALVASIFMIVCYMIIGIYLLRKMKSIAKNKSFEKSYRNTIQMTKMLVIVTIVFLISANTPYVVAFKVMLNPSIDLFENSIIFMFTMFFVINNFFNPYLYLAMSTSFRQRAKEVINTCFCLSPNPDEHTAESSTQQA